ncbi:MAG: acetolactate synthase small subunit [Leptospiraceae bacterium]|nr:acetolactate synthase small subunit [Leptospiraceae bacterium]MCB1316004.1 acetolactate synthase small subunit [Leptospiraceae bacterium]MCB1322718.1 acetolactate synthase small subunit [Leptospiraceae bacterium]
MSERTKHIISIYVRNRPGVMSHVSGLFTRRGFNIDSIAVGTTEQPEVSTMTIVMHGNDNDLVQFKGQLLKLPDVIELKTLPYHSSVVRELLLVRVKATADNRMELLAIVDVFEGKVSELTDETMLIEVNGNNRRIKGILNMLQPFGIIEMARTGQIALGFEADH